MKPENERFQYCTGSTKGGDPCICGMIYDTKDNDFHPCIASVDFVRGSKEHSRRHSDPAEGLSQKSQIEMVKVITGALNYLNSIDPDLGKALEILKAGK